MKKRLTAILLTLCMVMSLQPAGAFAKGELEVSTTPTASVTTVAKTLFIQASVDFALTNSPSYADDLIWKIYTDATGYDEVFGLTAENIGNTLTLSDELDIQEGDYYVSVTEEGKTESLRLKLTVGEYVTPLWTEGISPDAAAAFSGGDGAQDSPYLLSSAEDLAQLAVNVNTSTNCYTAKYFKLTQNIDLSGKNWVPIGYGTSTGSAFRGHFDGDDHIVDHMNILRSACAENTFFLGFFAWAYGGASVKNLGLTNASLVVDSWSGHDVGLLLGYADNSINIDNCFAIGTINASETVRSIGGLIGQNYSGGSLTNCYFVGKINSAGGTYVGGIVAYRRSAYPTNCYAAASITSYATNNYAIASSATNCYYDSTLNTTTISGDGTAKTTEQMKTAQTAALLGNVWGYDDEKNDGYPYLISFSEPRVIISHDSVYVKDLTESAKLMLASYAGEHLIDIKILPVSAPESIDISGTGLATGEADTLKAMLWKDTVNMQPLCKDSYILHGSRVVYNETKNLPTLDDSVATATSYAVNDYARAAMLTYELGQLVADDGDNTTPTSFDEIKDNIEKFTEAKAMLTNALAAWDRVLSSGAALDAVTDAEILRLYDEEPLFSLMSVEEPSDPLKWAQSITNKFDAFDGNNKIKQLASNMGCDAKRAYASLTMAQNILQGQYASDEGRAEEWIAILEGTKTASKVGVFLCGAAIAAGPTAIASSGYASAAEAAGYVVGGLDAVLSLQHEYAKIYLGADNKTTLIIKGQAEAASNAATLVGIVSGGGGSAGEKLAFLGDVGERAYNYTFDVNVDEEGNVTAQAKITDVEGGITAQEAIETGVDKGFKPETEATATDIENRLNSTASTDEKLKAMLETNSGVTDSLAERREEFEKFAEEINVYSGYALTRDGLIDNVMYYEEYYYDPVTYEPTQLMHSYYANIYTDELVGPEIYYKDDGKISSHICRNENGEIIEEYSYTYDTDGTIYVLSYYYYTNAGDGGVPVRWREVQGTDMDTGILTRYFNEYYAGQDDMGEIWLKSGRDCSYHSNGMLAFSTMYVAGKETGASYSYTSGGLLKKIANYQNGKFHGMQTGFYTGDEHPDEEYMPEGGPRSWIGYVFSESWYENGVSIAHRNYTYRINPDTGDIETDVYNQSGVFPEGY